MFLIVLNGPCVLGVILKELGKNSNFNVKKEVSRRGHPPLIHVIISDHFKF